MIKYLGVKVNTAKWNQSVIELRRSLGLTEQRREQLSWTRDVLFIDRESYEVCKNSKWAWPSDDISAECKGFFDIDAGFRYLIPIEELYAKS
jgi:hypothetical protein